MEEVAVVNLTNVRVDYKQDQEEMLNVCSNYTVAFVGLPVCSCFIFLFLYISPHSKQTLTLILNFYLQRQYVFFMYTANNWYMMQASSRDEMCSWLKQLDQFFNLSLIPA